ERGGVEVLPAGWLGERGGGEPGGGVLQPAQGRRTEARCLPALGDQVGYGRLVGVKAQPVATNECELNRAEIAHTSSQSSDKHTKTRKAPTPPMTSQSFAPTGDHAGVENVSSGASTGPTSEASRPGIWVTRRPAKV